MDQSTTVMKEEPFNKEAWAEQKQSEREQIYTLIDETTEKALSNNGFLQSYLSMQGKLGKTSVSNTLLVLAQKPDASYIAGYDDWQEKGRSVKKGEKAVLILEADREYKRQDGSLGMGFKPKRVFDVSQTHGKPMHERSIPNNVEKYIGRELVNTEFGDMDAYARNCVATVTNNRYGIDTNPLSDIPAHIKNLDSHKKREYLQDIREKACDIIECIDKDLYAERQQSKNQPER